MPGERVQEEEEEAALLIMHSTVPFCAQLPDVQLPLSEPAGVNKTKLMNSPTSPSPAPAWLWR